MNFKIKITLTDSQ